MLNVDSMGNPSTTEDQEPLEELLERVRRIEKNVVPTKAGIVMNVIKSIAKIIGLVVAVGGPVIGWNYAQVKRGDLMQCMNKLESDILAASNEMNAAAENLISCRGQESCDDALGKFEAVSSKSVQIPRGQKQCLEGFIPSSLEEVEKDVQRAIARMF
ncbi:hypothetical protein KKG51_04480 [Patescibacteria group bacterium]|nr:hypothetical protein [Patescibacteria group bacterium]